MYENKAILESKTFYHRLAWLWLAFCIVKIAGAVLLGYVEGKEALWKPWLNESSSLLVVSILAILQSRWLGISRHIDTRPSLWLREQLLLLPFWCVIFVVVTYSLRHAGYFLAGDMYHHEAWLRVFVKESILLCIFYLLWLGVIFGLVTRERLQAEQIRMRDTALALRETHLALLRQQLQPHFLFNALNLISATMYENVPRADQLLHELANLLRQASTQTTQALHSLDDELALLHSYADIMAARFEGRVELVWQIAPNLPICKVPSMIAQPLLENAFKYGVEPYSGGCRIELNIDRKPDGELWLRIMQNRGWYQETTAEQGTGLANIRRRLVAHYLDAAELTLSNLVPEGVCASIVMPCES